VPEVEDFRAEVGRFQGYVHSLPTSFSDHVEKNLAIAAGLVFFSLLGPLALVVLCCVAIFAVVCATRGAHGGGRCSRCCIHGLGGALFTPVVLVVAAVAAAELGAGVALGAFCRDADTNALTIIGALGDETFYNISHYYINKDDVANPLADALRQADASIADFDRELGNATSQCKHGAAESLAGLARSAQESLGALESRLSRAQVYPHYHKAVHEFACATVVSGLGWLSLSQIAVGLLCLPVLACMADSFFDRWVAWRASLQAGPRHGPYAIEPCAP